jgi:hypothetical protein
LDGQLFFAGSCVETPQEDREFNVSQRVRGIKSDKKNRFQLIAQVMAASEIRAVASSSEPPGPPCTRFAQLICH